MKSWWKIWYIYRGCNDGQQNDHQLYKSIKQWSDCQKNIHKFSFSKVFPFNQKPSNGLVFCQTKNGGFSFRFLRSRYISSTTHLCRCRYPIVPSYSWCYQMSHEIKPWLVVLYWGLYIPHLYVFFFFNHYKDTLLANQDSMESHNGFEQCSDGGSSRITFQDHEPSCHQTWIHQASSSIEKCHQAIKSPWSFIVDLWWFIINCHGEKKHHQANSHHHWSSNIITLPASKCQQ